MQRLTKVFAELCSLIESSQNTVYHAALSHVGTWSMAVGQHSWDISVQVFVHVPLLQAYFLGGGHMHKLCPRLTEHDKPGKCLSCELVTPVSLSICLLLYLSVCASLCLPLYLSLCLSLVHCACHSACHCACHCAFHGACYCASHVSANKRLSTNVSTQG